MAFSRPSLEQLVQRITADVETRLNIVGASLRNSFTKLFSKAVAGAAHLMHGHLEWIAKQVFPDTADDENAVRWASIWGIERNAASFAEGSVIFTGTVGTAIDEETELVSSDGLRFKTTEDAEIGISGSVTVEVRALTAGEDGNAALGTILNLLSPITGVDSEVEVSPEIAGGTDEETVEELRARLLERIQEPPLGGAVADYKQWAREVAGVTRVWVEPLYLGAGTVGIFFTRDNDDDSIFPSSGEVLEVSAYIDELRPIPAKHYVYAPEPQVIDFSITLSPEGDEDVQAAIEQELTDLLYRDGEPGGVIFFSRINEAISIAAGELDHTTTVPSEDVTLDDGKLPVMGTITWS